MEKHVILVKSHDANVLGQCEACSAVILCDEEGHAAPCAACGEEGRCLACGHCGSCGRNGDPLYN